MKKEKYKKRPMGITLTNELIELIDKDVTSGKRSEFIEQACRFFLNNMHEIKKVECFKNEVIKDLKKIIERLER